MYINIIQIARNPIQDLVLAHQHVNFQIWQNNGLLKYFNKMNSPTSKNFKKIFQKGLFEKRNTTTG